MPRMSLSALEILLRQTREDAELDAYPEVRRNLLTLIRSLQRQGLEQDEQTIAVGEVFDRRFLLLLVPTGGLKSADTMNTLLRTQEQVVKALNARRRAVRVSALWGKPGRSSAMWGGSRSGGADEQDEQAGESPAGVEDDAAEAAKGAEP